MFLPVSFDELYSKQKQVVGHQDGSLLILAGPGTEKTEVLTHRIAYLIGRENVPSDEILAITFTKKAANEMAKRLKEFDKLKGAQPRISTLHAESLRILNEIKESRRFLVDDDEARLLSLHIAGLGILLVTSHAFPNSLWLSIASFAHPRRLATRSLPNSAASLS